MNNCHIMVGMNDKITLNKYCTLYCSFSYLWLALYQVYLFLIPYFASFAADAEVSQYLLHQWKKSTYYLDTQESTENKKRKTYFNNNNAFLFFLFSHLLILSWILLGFKNLNFC